MLNDKYMIYYPRKVLGKVVLMRAMIFVYITWKLTFCWGTLWK